MYAYSSETEWALACEAAEVSHAPRGSRARQIAVKVLGWTCIAGGVAGAAWMLTSTPAEGAITSWSTMGSVAPARIAASRVDDVRPSAPAALATPPNGCATVAAVVDAGAPGWQGARTSASDRAADDAGAPVRQTARKSLRRKVTTHAWAPFVAPKHHVAALPRADAPPAKEDALHDPYADPTPQVPVEDNPYDGPQEASVPYRPAEP